MTDKLSFSERMRRLSPEQRRLLELHLKEKGIRLERLEIPARAEDREHYPLSFAQQRLWFLHQLNPESTAYHCFDTAHLPGKLNAGALAAAFDAVVRRHEALRTTFDTVQGRPVQVVHAPSALTVPLVDLQGLAPSAREGEMQRISGLLFGRPFELQTGPLLRVLVLRLGASEHVCMVAMHHIISDFWSTGIFLRELATLYAAFAARRPSPLPALKVQYPDFALWQREYFEREEMAEHLAYWRQRLGEGVPKLELPTDRPRSPSATPRGAVQGLYVPRALVAQLRETADRLNSTLYVPLVAGYRSLLARYSGQQDFAIGSTIANRNRPEVEPLVGFFVNTRVLRTPAPANQGFDQLLERERQAVLEADEHQDLPFEKLVEELSPERNADETPLFQVSFNLLTQGVDPGGDDEPSGSGKVTSSGLAMDVPFDLILRVWEAPGELKLLLYYKVDLFDSTRMGRLLGHYVNLLQAAVQQPETSLSELPLLSAAERQQLSSEWVDTRASRAEETVHGLVSAAARSNPTQEAVRCGGESLSYQELGARSTRLAHYLRGQGVGDDDLVAVCLERSLDLPVVLLAVLQAGAGYLPLDPAYPHERLAFMLEDSRAPLVITHASLEEALPGPDPSSGPKRLLVGPELWQEIAAGDGAAGDGAIGEGTALAPRSHPEGLCYAIYTSGSTGRPKGTLVTHRAVANRMRWLQYNYALDRQDRVLQKTPISFDVSAWELFWPLTAGATTVLARPGGHQDAGYLARAVGDQSITVCHFVPAMLRLFLEQEDLEQAAASLRLLIVSGEALPLNLGRQAEQRLKVPVINMYGPSEAARASFEPLSAGEQRPVVPLGRGAHNTLLRVLDQNLSRVPVGIAGELAIGGPVQARGYHRRPSLTAERFVPDPWSPMPGGRLYRTGDLVRLAGDGRVEFLGRIDHQIKLRGQRIELGEIEAVLAEHPSVSEAVAVVREMGDGDQRLLAYVVQDAGAEEETEEDRSEQVAEWKQVFERTYGEAPEDTDLTFHIHGWTSSYTLEGIPAEEMAEWMNETVARILAEEPQRLIEVGCGNGLLLYRIAPHVQSYRARDFSTVALANVAKTLPTQGWDSSHVTLEEHSAEDFGGVEPRSADTVVVNSVAQYFPSIDYLLQVVEAAVEAVEDGGRIFLGDLRSLPMLRTFFASVEAFQATAAQSLDAMREGIERRARQEEELVIDPAFFYALPRHLPRIGRVEVRLKWGKADNELSRYRYDVLMHIGNNSLPAAENLQWQEGASLELAAIQRQLQGGSGEPVAIRGLGNARLASDARLLDELALSASGASQAARNAGELRQRLQEPRGVDPEDLRHLARATGYEIAVSWGRSGTLGDYDVVFYRGEAKDWFAELPERGTALRPWRVYANQPMQAKFARRWIPRLQGWIKDRLPEAMQPQNYVLLEALPKTPSGKLDRRALPSPDTTRPELEGAYVAPRSEVEGQLVQIWQEVLGLEQVGVHDNFFDLGGHSLLLVRVHSSMKEVLDRELSLLDLFRFPTIATVAKALESEGPSGEGDRAQVGRDRAARRRLAQGQDVAELDAADQERVAQERDIAVVGYALRFPGASSPEEFWSNLRAGKETIRRWTDEELVEAGVNPAVLENPAYVKAQAFLDQADQFDAGLFGFTPREAQILDPQHRLFLECAWEALEQAAVDPETYEGAIGVFAGTGASKYWLNLMLNPDVASTTTGLQRSLANEKDFLPTRVSYKLDLRGPSVNVNTACSTSLVAAHMAIQSLLTGESDMALAGGASLTTKDPGGYLYEEGGVVSHDGSCRAFDEAGQGTLDGDGVGLVVLKRLRDALADGDPIRAVIRGSAINNDGSDKVGFTAPSIEGQAQVIAEAQAVAGIEPDSIQVVEAHGTATPLGDPIEVAALNQVFGTELEQGSVALGSVKTNFGHLGAAAGAAGLIKTVLALEHGEVPASLHFERSNPQIDFSRGPFFVNTELRSWPKPAEGPRRAGVSAFGLGGTNAHLVVEEAPEQAASTDSRPWQLLCWSAQSAEALSELQEELAAAADSLRSQASSAEDESASLADLAYTLRIGRKRLGQRRAAVAHNLTEAASLLRGEQPQRLLAAEDEHRERPVAFLFPGIGDHSVQMARGLYESEPVFRHEVDRCAELLRETLGLDLREVLYPGEYQEQSGQQGGGSGPDLRRMLSRGGIDGGGVDDPLADSPLGQSRIAQPAVFVIEWALAQLWQSWGVQPSALLGYSLGEYTAACVAGVFSLQDGLALVAERARLVEAMPTGNMLAVPLAAEELRAQLPPELDIAAHNTPGVTVVAGPHQAVAELERKLGEQGVASQRLQSQHAFHSRMLQPMAEPFRQLLAGMELSRPNIPYLSNVTGTWVTPEQATDPEHWVRHLLQTVHFAEGVAALVADPDRVLLEVGPGQALSTAARQHPERAAQQPVIASMRDNREQQSDGAFLQGALGRLWLYGVRPDWQGLVAHEQRRRLALPTYPFQRQSYWVEPTMGQGNDTGTAVAGPSEERRSDVAEWFLVPSWKPAEAPRAEEPPMLPGVLLFLDEAGLGESLAQQLEAAGRPVLRVLAGDSFEVLGEGRYRLAPAQAEGYNKLVQAVVDGQVPVGTVVHLWSYEAVPPDVDDAASQRATERGFYSLLYLAQALGGYPLPPSLDLLVVGAGLCSVAPGEQLMAERALVQGPCRTLPHEYPGVRCRVVDLSFDNTNPPLAALLSELDGRDYPLAVAWRGGERFVESLEPLHLEAEHVGAEEDHPTLRPGGCYLITGGLGGLGLVLAEKLARELQAKLVLTARSALPPREQWDAVLAAEEDAQRSREKIQGVRQLESHGAEVLTLAAEASDAQEMAQVLAQARQRFGRVDGVFHTAGIPGEGLVQLKTRDKADEVLQPKVAGTRILERLLAEDPPEFLVLYSSLAGVSGGLGQVDYVAGNAFLDAYAHGCRGGRGPAGRVISVDWGLWREVGMGARQIVGEVWEAQHQAGLDRAVTPEEGLEALWRILARSRPQVLVSTTDFRPRLERTRGWVQADFQGHTEAPAGAKLATYPRPALATPFVAPEGEAEGALAGIWQEMIGLDEVGRHDNFFELGGDSLLATQVVSRIRAQLQIEVPLASFFEAPTVAELAQQLAGEEAEEQAGELSEIESALASIQDLSEDELDAALSVEDLD